MKSLTSTIYTRAKAHGIEIRKDGSRWDVIYPNESEYRKVYQFTGTLESVGLRLELITQDEVDKAHDMKRCPYGCPASIESFLRTTVEYNSSSEFRCPNCGTEFDRNGKITGNDWKDRKNNN